MTFIPVFKAKMDGLDRISLSELQVVMSQGRVSRIFVIECSLHKMKWS